MLNISDVFRGYTDTIILGQLMKRDSYGYEINKQVKLITNDGYELKEATLYTAFRRLESKGMILSYWGPSDKGARRRYYTITDLGKREYVQNASDWNNFKKMIDEMIGSQNEE